MNAVHVTDALKAIRLGINHLDQIEAADASEEIGSARDQLAEAYRMLADVRAAHSELQEGFENSPEGFVQDAINEYAEGRRNIEVGVIPAPGGEAFVAYASSQEIRTFDLEAAKRDDTPRRTIIADHPGQFFVAKDGRPWSPAYKLPGGLSALVELRVASAAHGSEADPDTPYNQPS